MSRWKVAMSGLMLSAGWMLIHPAPQVEALGSMDMAWMPTANWLGCDQNGPAPECADYGTPTGGAVMMTCCVPLEALGTSDMSACVGGGTTRGRSEL